MPLLLRGSIAVDVTGSRLALEGEIVLPGIAASLTLSHELAPDRPRTKCELGEVLLISPDEWLIISSASSPLTIPRSSPLRIHARDANGLPLAGASSLGIFDNRPLRFSVSLHVPATVIVEVTTEGRMPGLRAPAAVGGKLVFGGGIVVRCSFGEASGRYPGAGQGEIVAVTPGRALHFPQRLAPFPASMASTTPGRSIL